jgi:hypothetical protein
MSPPRVRRRPDQQLAVLAHAGAARVGDVALKPLAQNEMRAPNAGADRDERTTGKGDSEGSHQEGDGVTNRYLDS